MVPLNCGSHFNLNACIYIYIYIYIYILYIYIYIYYTGCPRRNVPDFGRVFLMLKYTDITQNTCPKLNSYGYNGQRKSVVFWRVHALYLSADKSYRSLSLCGVRLRKVSSHQLIVGLGQNAQSAMLRQCLHSCVMYSDWNPKDNYYMRASFFVVQFNGFMSLTS